MQYFCCSLPGKRFAYHRQVGIRIDPMMGTVRIVNSEFKGPGNIELVAQKAGKDKIDFVVYSISR